MTGKSPGAHKLIIVAQADMKPSDSITATKKPMRRSRTPAESAPGFIRRLRDPRSAVLVLMTAVLLIGGGRRLLRARAARQAVALLDDPSVSPEAIRAVAQFGRAGLFELFRLFGSASDPAQRTAAGAAIARLWAEDQLVAEEEQAFTRRAYEVTWHARRRYPRELKTEIPIIVSFGLPILESAGPGIAPENLEWSHRILGARRAALEEESPWKKGNGRVEFSVFPDDFESNGPHQLVLETKVRTTGLTTPWEIELPKMAFRFELDPGLQASSLLTLPDEPRAERMNEAVRLESPTTDAIEPNRPLPINESLVIRNPPTIIVDRSAPCDLAHRVELEIEGVEGYFEAGRVVVRGQIQRPSGAVSDVTQPVRITLKEIRGLDPSRIDRPGRRRIRVRLTADPDLGWGDPEVRSIWPGEIETGWVEVEVSRR